MDAQGCRAPPTAAERPSRPLPPEKHLVPDEVRLPAPAALGDVARQPALHRPHLSCEAAGPTACTAGEKCSAHTCEAPWCGRAVHECSGAEGRQAGAQQQHLSIPPALRTLGVGVREVAAAVITGSGHGGWPRAQAATGARRRCRRRHRSGGRRCGGGAALQRSPPGAMQTCARGLHGRTNGAGWRGAVLDHSTREPACRRRNVLADLQSRIQ